MPRVPYERLYPKASELAINLLYRMLDFDPTTRITVEEALAHPYLAAYHDPSDEVSGVLVANLTLCLSLLVPRLIFRSNNTIIWTVSRS